MNNQGKSILQKIVAIEEKKRYIVSYDSKEKSKIESFEERIKLLGFKYQEKKWTTDSLTDNLDFKGLVRKLKSIKKLILANESSIIVSMKSFEGDKNETI